MRIKGFKIRKEYKKEDGFTIREVVAIMIVTILLGMLLGSAITYNKYKNPVAKESKDTQEIKEFKTIYNTITDNYYKNLNKTDLMNNAIKGMIESLDDDYALYMDKDEAKRFNNTITGTYVGIGCEMYKNKNNLIVSKVLNKSGASEAGIKENDIVLKINDIDTKDKEVSELVKLIQDSKNKTIQIKIKRQDKVIDLNVVKKDIKLSMIETINFDGVGYIKINMFTSTSYNDFNKELQKLEKNNIKDLIIDVRDNSGGYLSEVAKIANLFIEKDKIIYGLSRKNSISDIKDDTDEKRQYKIVVLINEKSASASEILAGALKYSYGATIIGTKSFGKGTVQNGYSLTSGAEIKFTTQEWLLPNNTSLNKTGLAPDIEVKNVRKDEQLDKAKEILS